MARELKEPPRRAVRRVSALYLRRDGKGKWELALSDFALVALIGSAVLGILAYVTFPQIAPLIYTLLR